MSNDFVVRNNMIVKGDFDIFGNVITSSITNSDIRLLPNGTGRVKIGALYFPTSDGTAGQVLSTDGSGNLVWLSGGGGSGEINTAASLGTALDGAEIVGPKLGSVLQFRRIKAGANITVTEETNDVLIGVTGLATVATSGQWNDLLGKPTFANIAFSGAIADLSGAGTAATLNVGTSAGQIPVLDSNGKLVNSVLPAISITEVNVVANETERLALTVQTGDVAIQTDNNTSYIYDGTAWQVLSVGGSGVTSVNGQTGVVNLTMANITGVPTASGYLRWNGSAFVWDTPTGGLTDIVQDTTPQLGGNLDVNGHAITSTADINLNPGPGGSVVIGNTGAAIIESDTNQNMSIVANGTGELTLTGTKILAGAGYVPTDALSLVTKQYVDSAVGVKTTVNLPDNTATAVITRTASTSDVMFVNYVIRRNGAMRAGQLIVINDGVTVSFSDAGPEINDVGVTFTAAISTGQVTVTATTTSTGQAGTFNFIIQEMDI